MTNSNDFDCVAETVELPSDSLLTILGSRYCYVTGPDGAEIPSQLTHDGKLIFQATVAAGGSGEYNIHPSDTLHSYTSTVSGRIYPERADDIAWENENVGFRIYGPATQAKGEKAFGYDIFFKHPTSELILERLYEPETSPATWQKVDSLRAIDPALAEEFIRSFSYHIDHGLGMDCYAVGPTLGAGVAALTDNDSICFPWCYEHAEVMDNGPLRFTVRLDFAPVKIGADTAVTEHRLVTLDANSYLNRCKVWYDGLSGTAPRTIVAGFPRRDDSTAVMDTAGGILAYADPTQGPDNGKAMLGLVMTHPADSMLETAGHILAFTKIAPSDTLGYNWGFAWDRGNISDMTTWEAYLGHRSVIGARPLTVTYK